MRAWQKTPVNEVRKNLTCFSEKTFRSGRFSQGHHWERVWMMRESSISRRECDGKVSPVCSQSPLWMRTWFWMGWSDLVVSSFSSPLSQMPVEFSVTPSSVIFEFLVIFKAPVTSSVYCSMTWASSGFEVWVVSRGGPPRETRPVGC
jgi:hypothetical protein